MGESKRLDNAGIRNFECRKSVNHGPTCFTIIPTIPIYYNPISRRVQWRACQIAKGLLVRCGFSSVLTGAGIFILFRRLEFVTFSNIRDTKYRNIGWEDVHHILGSRWTGQHHTDGFGLSSSCDGPLDGMRVLAKVPYCHRGCYIYFYGR